MTMHIVLMLTALLLAGGALADAVLFDFETDDEVNAWRIRTPNQDKLVSSDEFASSGQSSMVFTSPAYKQGMEQWPAFEAKPPIADWQGYDRLLVDIVNPNEERYFLSLLVSDSKVPFRNGLSFRFDLPSRGFKHYEIPLSRLPDSVDRADISILHFFSERPGTDMKVYVDNLRLLKPGEEAAQPGAAFVRQVANLSMEGLRSLDDLIEDCRKRLYAKAETPAERQMADTELAAMSAQVDRLRAALNAPDLTLASLEKLRHEHDRVLSSPKRVEATFVFRKEFDKLPHRGSPMLVGFASSMVKLLPRDIPFEVAVAEGMDISLARNEDEAFQVAVMPRSEALTGVTVSVSDLRTDAGAVLPAARIDCDVVGHVETKSRPPYKVSYVGWWPDPILDFLGPVDIDPGDLQAFWIRVRAPKDQPAGLYRGTLTVSAANAEALNFDLDVRVYDFTLPDHTPLPTAITFFERKSQMGGEENWGEMKLVYADFLADYYIDYDSLYRSGAPDYEIIQHLHDQGKLVAFNLGNVFNAGTKEEGFDKAIADTVERIRPAYEEAKRLGLLDHAYIYGFDERPKEQFPLLERSAQALRKAFPEVLLMTTSYDRSYGLGSVVETIDAWCPLTPRFNPELAGEARAQGKKVWWYICCGPHNPFANWFVEYAAIESRLLMGAMTAKMRPDGFLYYSLSIWNDNKPIETGPFTDWNPVSWTVYHGDGSLLCSAPGGKPVPTIRLENYRDGQEDFAYTVILEDIIRQYEARGDGLSAAERDWLAEAKAAVTVPEDLVKTMAEYSRDPQKLYAYRNRIGDLINRSDVSDANPWGNDFGVRGFGGP